MYAKLKVRARLILVGKRFSVFFYSLMFFVLRLCSALIMAGSLVLLFFMFSQKSEYLDISGGHFFIISLFLILMFLISLYFYALLYLKRCKFFDNIIKEKAEKKIDESFADEIKASFRVIASSFFIMIIKAIWFLFFCFPSIALLVLVLYKLNSGGIAANVLNILILSIACLFIFGILFYFCTIQRYFIAVRMAGLNKLKVFDAIKTSAKTIDGWSASIAVFKIGLSLWYFLCLFLVPMFYIVPYSRLSFELLCKKHMSSQNEEEDINIYSTKKLPKI